MTDKEQIIIHGIDVSKCKFYRPGSFPTDCEINPVNAYCESPTSSNCYFKQLARKAQELEVICKAFDIEYAYDDDGKIFGRSNKLRSLEQECEELKERLERTEEDLKYQCLDCMNIKSDHYRKALDEIEEVCLKDTYTFADGTTVRYDTLDDILEIINIATGERDKKN